MDDKTTIAAQIDALMAETQSLQNRGYYAPLIVGAVGTLILLSLINLVI